MIKLDSQILLAKNTKKSYAKAWDNFYAWAAKNTKQSLPANQATILEYLDHLAKTKNNPTIEIAIAAIKKQHEVNDFEVGSKKINRKLAEIKRLKTKPTKQAKPVLAEMLSKTLLETPKTLKDLRDQVILAIGFSAALRSQEIVNLKVEDFEFINDKKMLIKIAKSKTDQTGRGYQIPVINGSQIKAVDLAKTWIRRTGLETGWLFRNITKSGKLGNNQLRTIEISRLVKKHFGADYSSHSLRAGFITSAAKANARLDKIQEISRHKSLEQLVGYIRDANKFDNHAGSSFL